MNRPSLAIDSMAATAGVTLATVPVDQLITPLVNVLTGVFSALLLKGISWVINRKW
jgi:hypothetical protein